MDGVRKKAKYLHDAPDGALMPGVGGSYPHMNGNHSVPHPIQEQATVSLPQGGYYTQAPPTAYYTQNPNQGQVPGSSQDGSPIGQFNNPQAPISPPYSQNHQTSMANVPSTVSQGPQPQMQQFGGPLFDPSDPALFNFDISSLNFGNHYGALEMGMLGHMSSGAADTPPSDSMMNPLNQAAGMYGQQASYPENQAMNTAMSFGPDGVPSAEWQNAHSRQGSLQMQTPNNTPITATTDHGNHRQESLHGPHAYAIGQGPASLSSASPSSIDVNNAYDTENPLSAATYFTNSSQQQGHQRSPTVVNRMQQENRYPSNALQPIQYNALRKRRRDTKWIYEGITKPYNYVRAFHRLTEVVRRRFCPATQKRIHASMGKYRPVLINTGADLTFDDLVHQERTLQRSLAQIEDFYSEVSVPSLVCRRSGEVIWMNKEFEFLTGWSRDILLGKSPNMNINNGSARDNRSDSEMSTRTSTTPIMAGQEPYPGPNPVSIVELLDERSAVEWFDDFAEVSYPNPRETPRRRINMLRYRTAEDRARAEEMKSHPANGKPLKSEPLIKLEGGPVHRGEEAMKKLGSRDGLVDCMIQWQIKRDNFDMPMLVCMHVRIPCTRSRF